jgi:hypothetical protein
MQYYRFDFHGSARRLAEVHAQHKITHCETDSGHQRASDERLSQLCIKKLPSNKLQSHVQFCWTPDVLISDKVVKALLGAGINGFSADTVDCLPNLSHQPKYNYFELCATQKYSPEIIFSKMEVKSYCDGCGLITLSTTVNPIWTELERSVPEYDFFKLPIAEVFFISDKVRQILLEYGAKEKDFVDWLTPYKSLIPYITTDIDIPTNLSEEEIQILTSALRKADPNHILPSNLTKNS